MNWAGLVFLLGYYWPYLLAAGLVGLAVGWRSFTPPKA